MEFCVMDMGLHGLTSNIGALVGEDFYEVADSCEEALEELSTKLDEDDVCTLHVRRQLAIGQIIQKDLVPIIKYVKTDPLIIADAIKVFAKVSMPLETLESPVIMGLRSTAQVHQEMQGLLAEAKKVLADEKLAESILEEMRTVLDEETTLSTQGRDLIYWSLILLRNVLSIQVSDMVDPGRIIVMNLLDKGFAGLFTDLVNLPGNKELAIPLVQVLYQIYSGQHTTSLPEAVAGLSLEDNSCGAPRKLVNRDQEFREKLQAFTMEFVAKGMGTLIQKLQFELFSAQKQNGDESYFLWVIKRFVKLAVLEQVSFESVKTVLAVPTFSLVTFLAVASCEQLMLLQRKNADASPHEKILKLAVAALHDMLWTVEYFMTEKKRALKQQDKEYLLNLHAELSSMEDIRQMFLLLIRLYQPHLQNLDYLKKLIITNHSYILMLQKATPTGNFDMLHHIKQFATEEVMQHYGRLLETFTENVPAVNECIFTMMHHIAGPCEKPESLLQINILKTFSEISHHQYPLNEDASDLVEYILKIFERLAERDPYHCAQQLLKMKEDEPGSPESESDQTESLDSHWSDEDVDILFMTYTEHESDPNLVDKIVEALEDHGISKTRCEVTNQLTHLGLLADQSMNLIDVIGCGSSVETTDSEISTDDASLVQDTAAILNRCVKKLEGKGHQVHLAWLQRVLLEVCYIKLGGKKIYGKVEEPILYFYVAQDKSVPVIPFSGAQEAILQDKAFRCLLLSLGIYLPEEGWQLYPRIPHFWNAENLFSKAKSLGTIPKGILKFHPDDIQSGKSDQLSSVESEPSMSTSLQGYKLTDGSTKRSQSNSNISSALWMAFVQQCNLERSKIGMGGISRKMEQNSTSSDSSLNMRVGQVD